MCNNRVGNSVKRKFIGLCFITCFVFTGCSGGSLDIDVDLDGLEHVKEWGGREKKTSTEDLTVNDLAATELNITIDMGSISVGYSDHSEAVVNVDFEASGPERERLPEILDVVGIDYEITGDVFQIRVINKETKENIWDWIHKKFDSRNNKGNYNLNVDLEILVPTTIKSFEIANSMGDIELNSVKGAFTVNNDMGSVKLKEVTFTEDSEIQVAMGNIDCELSEDSPVEAKVTMSADMGNISLDTNGLSYTSEKEDEDDDFMGGTETIILNKVCTIEATVDMGDIRLD